MNTFASRLKSERLEKGISQQELAEMAGVSQSLITKIENGNAIESKKTNQLAKALGVNPYWLATGQGESKPPSNASYLGTMEAWDSSSPLNADDIELPYFREVELSAGNGRHEVIENHGEKLRFSKATLKKQGVQIECAYCVKVSGNSMEPVLPDGCTVGIDTSKKTLVNGDWYAIDHGGELRVKVIYKMPHGKIRLRSFNCEEWPDETISIEEIKILGRVFWWSGLR